MERLTQKDDFFDYVLPEQNIFGDNQAFEISLGKTEYTCKLHITGEAIKRFGELEDVLEKYGIDNLDEFIKEYSSRNIKLANDNYALEQQLAELKEKLTQYENIEKEIGCDIEIFWKVYRRLSGHGKYDIHLYSLFNNEIVEIMPTEIISGTYSNYPQDCSFKYLVWDKICESYQETYSYFHFHDYNNEWFLSKEEAEKKLAEIRGEKDE